LSFSIFDLTLQGPNLAAVQIHPVVLWCISTRVRTASSLRWDKRVTSVDSYLSQSCIYEGTQAYVSHFSQVTLQAGNTSSVGRNSINRSNRSRVKSPWPTAVYANKQFHQIQCFCLKRSNA